MLNIVSKINDSDVNMFPTENYSCDHGFSEGCFFDKVKGFLDSVFPVN